LIVKKLGEPTSLEDLKAIDPDEETPQYELYDDGNIEGTEKRNIPDIDDVTP
jgi:hypothetical protein